MRKSLLYITPFDPTVAVSGSAVRARLILRFLAEHYETHVVHLRTRSGEGWRDEGLAGRLASLTAVDYSEAGYFLFSRALYQRAAEVLKSRRIDFLFAEFDKAGAYAWRLSRRFGKPYFYAPHNVESRRYLNLARAMPPRLALAPLVYFLERQACRHARAIFAISEEDAAVFRSWAGEGRVSVLPLAFDEEVFHPFSKDAEPREGTPPVVLMVGNFGYAATREAAYRVRDQVLPGVLSRHPRAVFRFVGPGLPDDIRHSATANLEAAGVVEDLAAEYRRAMVVIAPITLGGGIRVKVVEALAMGRFLVATPKAMQGIDAAGLTHLAVAPLNRFAEAVSDALARRPGRSAANWERVSRLYGTRNRLADLKSTIEATLDA